MKRREFLKTGLSLLSISLTHFEFPAQIFGQELEEKYPYREWEDIYRKKWTWDKVTWGTHLVDCYPGNCLWKVYSKDGVVLREEQAGKYPFIEEGIPDKNPRGCQKGGSYSRVMYGRERLKYPLKRIGKRGEGKWRRISWDEALSEIADAVIEAIVEGGPESIIYEESPGEGGIVNGIVPGVRLFAIMRGVLIDLNSVISDFNAGNYITFGKFQFVAEADDWAHAELILIWHMNPVYTRVPAYHFIAEARYKGAEVITIAPDFSPSAIHADYHIPVEPGTDSALALAMCRVIVEEGKVNWRFVKEQTDLPLLVRMDTKKFLRESDLKKGGKDYQFYFYDKMSRSVVPAPLKTLHLGLIDPAVEGEYEVKLKSGKKVKVKPVFELVKEKLKDYSPEKASKICGVNPEVIRELAIKVAQKKTHILLGWNTCKYYHGDLIERSMNLLLALTGNWGKKGTGTRGWSECLFPGLISFISKRKPGIAGGMELIGRLEKVRDELLKEDPTLSEEMIAIEAERRLLKEFASHAPAVFYWYYHCGYKEVWNRKEWGDPTMKRKFDEYFKEAIEKGWWDHAHRPLPDTPPRVLFQVAGSTLRRTRGGLKMLLKHLWPKLKMIVTVDTRMSTTAYFSDIVLPAAGFYEKVDVRFSTPHIPYLTFTDKAVEPFGEAKPEWEIFCLLAKKIQEKAKERGLGEVKDRWGYSFRLDEVYDEMTMKGYITEKEGEKVLEEMIADSVLMGTLPRGTDLKKLREEGIIRYVSVGGVDPVSMNNASDLQPDETLNPLRWHTERKIPYPTLTRRAQFYIDHDWFIEAGEELPVHKDTPKTGGNYPFVLTSGHLKWSIHSIWVVNRLLLNLHRGEPFMFMNPEDARRKGIKDGDYAEVYNDFASFRIMVKISPAVKPGQLIIYHAWEPYLFKDWKSYDVAIPGMVKWLHLAGGYGHLKYWRWNWFPQQVDRAIRVDVRKSKV